MKIQMEENYWQEIEALKWGIDFNYERIANELAVLPPDTSKAIKKFARGMQRNLMEAIKDWEEENRTLDICSDDGFNDVTAHIVGLGEQAFNAAIENPVLVETRYNAEYGTAEGYTENFNYSFLDI